MARAAACAQKNVAHQVPVALAHLEKRHARIDAGVVDEHVDTTELAHDLRDHRLNTRGLCDVGLDEHGAPAGAADLLDDLVGRAAIVEIVHADVGAFTRERERDRTSDTLLGAGHQRHFSGEPHRLLLTPHELCRPSTNVLGSRRELIREEPMDKGIGLWLNIGSLILVAALVIDFVWVIKTALNAH